MNLGQPSQIKLLLLLFLALAGLVYVFGGGRDALASSVGDSGSSTGALPTYSGGPWQGALSAYPAGYGAVPYTSAISLGGATIQGPPLYGGS